MLHYEFDRRIYAGTKERLINSGFFDLTKAYQPVHVAIGIAGYQMTMVVCERWAYHVTRSR